MFTVMGATGHTGSRITRTLREAGAKVRAIGRSETKLAELASAGAEVVAGDGTDAAFLTTAFRGAEGVYTLIPSDPQAPDFRASQDAVGEAIVKAIRDAQPRHVVFLSSLGGDVPSGTGPIAGLHAQEERLRRLQNVNVLILRPAYFFENFYDMLGLIKEQGINGGAIAGDLQMPMIATRDIADVAANALKERSWQGFVVRELHGQRDLTHAEATRILGARIGKPDLPYVQFPYAEYPAALVQAGLSQDAAHQYTEMARSMNDGIAKPLEARKPENTTPTSFEEFADELARAYAAI
jgi:uncharacterized protein YbjT (DUF2867 family)